MGRPRLNILVLGGTRFCGKLLVELLVKRAHQVVVSSRKPCVVEGVEQVTGERDALLAKLSQMRNFDLVIDFTAYNRAQVTLALQAFPSAAYFFISTIWIDKLNSGFDVNVPVNSLDYINNKLAAENELLNAARSNATVALRLPILMGSDDHTGRTSFYVDRLADGHGCIMVNGGLNQLLIRSAIDVASDIADVVEMEWTALPRTIDFRSQEVVSLKLFLSSLRDALGSNSPLLEVSAELLKTHLPDFLNNEPFWQEQALSQSAVSVAEITNVQERFIADWIHDLFAVKPEVPLKHSQERAAEIQFISSLNKRV